MCVALTKPTFVDTAFCVGPLPFLKYNVQLTPHFPSHSNKRDVLTSKFSHLIRRSITFNRSYGLLRVLLYIQVARWQLLVHSHWIMFGTVSPACIKLRTYFQWSNSTIRDYFRCQKRVSVFTYKYWAITEITQILRIAWCYVEKANADVVELLIAVPI